MNRYYARSLTAAVFTFGCMLVSQPCDAGVGPENVVVVVNADSHDSRTIANHYVQLRNIPSSNVVFLSDVPTGLKIRLDDFESKILRPVLEQLNFRQIAAQTRVIAYSASFPTSVDISVHTKKLTDPLQKKYQLPTASLTGLTYLYQFILADSEKFLDWGSNFYARGPFQRHFANPFVDERRQRFDMATSRFDLGEFSESAEEFEKLLEQSPTISPLAIRAAEARMHEGDTEAAKSLIVQAVSAGWNSGRYFRESDVLSPLLDDPKLKSVAEALSDLPTIAQEPVGFAGELTWTVNGHPVREANDGVRYIMSCMLAVVHPLGSNVDQATKVLQRAAKSDHSYPEASVWLTNTNDVRTKTRFPGYGDALLWLGHLEHDAEIIHAVMPDREGDCIGLMLGTAAMNLDNRKWKFVPGAIAENLTSLSAHFGTDSQTKITELLHAGAAISSGPVEEPYSLPFKFPLALMHGYYASGVTALEAFYLSVSSPYQLLIVGDPLAQPYAKPPNDWATISVRDGPKGQQQLHVARGVIGRPGPQNEVRAIEVFIEGKLIRRFPAVANVELNLPSEFSGTMEIRMVLVGSDPTQPRADHVKWVEFKGASPPPIAQLVEDGGKVLLECAGANSIDLIHHGELVGSIKADRGEIEIDRDRVGSGPVRVRPVARFKDRQVAGRPLVLEE